MNVLHFGEVRESSPHGVIIKIFLKKLWKSIYKCEIDVFGINQNYLNKFMILDNAENLGA